MNGMRSGFKIESITRIDLSGPAFRVVLRELPTVGLVIDGKDVGNFSELVTFTIPCVGTKEACKVLRDLASLIEHMGSSA